MRHDGRICADDRRRQGHSPVGGARDVAHKTGQRQRRRHDRQEHHSAATAEQSLRLGARSVRLDICARAVLLPSPRSRGLTAPQGGHPARRPRGPAAVGALGQVCSNQGISKGSTVPCPVLSHAPCPEAEHSCRAGSRARKRILSTRYSVHSHSGPLSPVAGPSSLGCTTWASARRWRPASPSTRTACGPTRTPAAARATPRQCRWSCSGEYKPPSSHHYSLIRARGHIHSAACRAHTVHASPRFE